MWHIIKAEVNCDKYSWFIVSIPLILSIPILYTQGETWLNNDQATQIIINIGKGVIIVIALLILRLFIGFMIINPITRLHMRPPIPIRQLGLLRVFKIVGLLLCALVLIALNILALGIEPFTYISIYLILGVGMLLSTLSLLLVVSDLLSIFIRMPNYRGQTALLFTFTGAILLVPYYKPYMHHLLNWPIAIAFNIVGIGLLLLSVYTFSRLRTFIIKVMK